MIAHIKFTDGTSTSLKNIAKFTVPSGNLRQWYFILEDDDPSWERGVFYYEDIVRSIDFAKESELEDPVSLEALKGGKL